MDEKFPREICEEVLIKKSSIFNSFWVIIPLVLLIMGSAVAWSLTISNDVSTLKANTAQMSTRLDKLDQEINRKLDLLIERTNHENRIAAITKGEK